MGHTPLVARCSVGSGHPTCARRRKATSRMVSSNVPLAGAFDAMFGTIVVVADVLGLGVEFIPTTATPSGIWRHPEGLKPSDKCQADVFSLVRAIPRSAPVQGHFAELQLVPQFL